MLSLYGDRLIATHINDNLGVSDKPNRHENDKYVKMTLEEYIAECYIRVCKVAYLKNGN